MFTHRSDGSDTEMLFVSFFKVKLERRKESNTAYMLRKLTRRS